jgi:hypothetical protein
VVIGGEGGGGETEAGESGDEFHGYLTGWD